MNLWKIFFYVLSCFFASASLASPVANLKEVDLTQSRPATQYVIGTLQSFFPNALKQVNTQVYSFCPDNTCIEFSNKRGNNSLEAVAIYLFYEGDYYELEHWRSADNIENNINILLKVLGMSGCVHKEKCDHSCIKNSFRRLKINVNNTRYDEGKKHVERIW